MPTVKSIEGPYRVFFYSFDCNEPKHVHIRRERKTCKFWLEPVVLASNEGFAPQELNRVRQLILQNVQKIMEAGESTVEKNEPRITSIEVSDDSITAQLVDGRMISVPVVWSWRLANATPEQRNNFEILGSGQGVHWPDIDEDISARGMLEGIPARPAKQPA